MIITDRESGQLIKKPILGIACPAFCRAEWHYSILYGLQNESRPGVPWQIVSVLQLQPFFLLALWGLVFPFLVSPHSFHFSLQIQVIEDDRNNRGSEPFVTGVRGQVPPLVTTNFLVKDQGEKGINSSLWRLFPPRLSAYRWGFCQFLIKDQPLIGL